MRSETSAIRPPAARQVDQDRLGREMHAVRDQLHDHVRPRERGAGDAGIAMPEGSHRVEEVRHRSRPLIERRLRDRSGCVRVAERDGDVAADERVDQLARAQPTPGPA